jgi:hypothetical protein
MTKYAFMALFVLLFGFHDVQAQSGKKKTQHEEERLQADAYALAYITCKYELTKYKSEQDDANTTLKKELKMVNGLYKQFSLRSDLKLKQKPELYSKFNRYVKSGWKELSVCIKYQNLLDSLEEMENKSQ